VPPRIDKSFVDSYAGSVQPVLLSTLRTIGLISDDGVVQSALRDAAQGPEERKQVIRSWAEGFYAEQIRHAEAAETAQTLHASFARHGYSGSTLRKAIVFYLALSDDVGLPKSPHFKAPKQAPGATTARRKRRSDLPGSTGVPADTVPPPAETGRSSTAEHKTAYFGDAGQVTISVDVKWLDLPENVFLALRKIVRDLESLGAVEAHGQAVTPPTEGEPQPEGT
jgi:hypothetical protein